MKMNGTGQPLGYQEVAACDAAHHGHLDICKSRRTCYPMADRKISRRSKRMDGISVRTLRRVFAPMRTDSIGIDD